MSENKIAEYLNQLKKVDGLHIADTSPEDVEFEANYIKVREYEQRVLTDAEVSKLPVLKNNPHSKEWEKRARSAQRLSRYFSTIQGGKVLDLGCGNGWFTALLAKNKNLEVVGMDVNLTELKQAVRVFKNKNLDFICGDIFQALFQQNTFDYITINASVQYFKDLDLLISRLMGLLNDNGEIHIIDSPFYKETDLESAKDRTANYYMELGFPEMSKHYYFHSWSTIFNYNYEILYNVKQNIISRLLGKQDMPFPWIKILK